MSLSHLGNLPEPVFDAVCPIEAGRFPVARRVVSHAARSLFSGKLLFPVATAGKEGQHCFSVRPDILFRHLPARRLSPPRLAFEVTPDHLFPPDIPASRLACPPLAGDRPGPLRACPLLFLHTIPGLAPSGMPLADKAPHTPTHVPPRDEPELHRPRLSHRMLLSIFEHLRLRRFSSASESPILREPDTLSRYPQQEQPDRILWRSWITTPRRTPFLFLEVPARTHPAPKLPPPLFAPSLPETPPNFVAPELYKLVLWPFQHDWNPAPLFLHHPVLPSLPSCRFPTDQLLSHMPAFDILERPLRMHHAPRTPEEVILHSLQSSFSAPDRLYIADTLAVTSPRLLPSSSIPHPDRTVYPPSSLLAPIARARLAGIPGQHPLRPFKSWPASAFQPLRRLRFNPAPWNQQRFFIPGLPGFAPLVPTSLQTVAALPPIPRARQTRIAASSPRGILAAGFRPLRSTPPRLPAFETLHPVQKPQDISSVPFRPPSPPPALSLGLSRNDIILISIHKPTLPAWGNLTCRQPRSFTTPFIPQPPSPTPYYEEIRQPVQPMVLLASAPRLRQLRPLHLPRHVGDATLLPRMIRAAVSLPRRYHSVRNYLLSLETHLSSWRFPPPPRRVRLAAPRPGLEHHSFTPPTNIHPPDIYLYSYYWCATVLRHILAPLERETCAPPPPARVSIARQRPRLASVHTPDSGLVTGPFTHDAPEWIRLRRLPRLRIRLLPSFYEFTPTAARFGPGEAEGKGMTPGWRSPAGPAIPLISVDGRTTAGRTSLTLPEPEGHAASAPGAFALRHRERVRSPYSLRNPRRWLPPFHPESEGIPSAYPQAVTLLPSHPSRLDREAREPGAFVGPAFRAPWRDVDRQLDLEVTPPPRPAAPPPPELIAFARAALRPALDTPRTFPEVPLPAALTLPRPESLRCSPPPLVGIRTTPVISTPFLAPALPVSDQVFSLHDRLTNPIDTFLELVPESMPEILPALERNSWKVLEAQAPRVHDFEGLFTARLRNLQFPYSPDPRIPTPDATRVPANDVPDPVINAAGVDEMPERFTGIAFADIPYLPSYVRNEIHTLQWSRSERTPEFDIGTCHTGRPRSVDVSRGEIPEFRSPPRVRSFATDSRTADSGIRSSFPSFSFSSSNRSTERFVKGSPVELRIPHRYPPAYSPVTGFPSLHATEVHLIILPGRWRRRVADPDTYRSGGHPHSHIYTDPAREHTVSRFLAAIPLPRSRSMPLPVPRPLPRAECFPHPISDQQPVNTPGRIPEPFGTKRPAPPAVFAATIPTPHSPAPPLKPRTEMGFPARLDTRRPSLPVHPHVGLRLPPMAYPAWDFADRRGPTKLRGSLPRRAALKLPSLPDWIELPPSRPTCGGCVDLPSS